MNEAFYEKDRDVAELYVSKAVNTRCFAHFHNSLEIIYLLSGSFHVIVDGVSYSPQADELVFIPSFSTHIIPKSDSTSITLTLPKEMLALFTNFTHSQSFPTILQDKEFNRKHLKGILETLLNEQTQTNPLLLYGRAYSVLGMIASHYPLKKNLIDTNHNFAIKVITYINENFKNKITLDSISSHFHYSKFYFSKMFKKTLNCSFPNYLYRIRTQYVASEIEKDSQTSLTDLIFSAGFDSLSTFYRYFKIIYNTSPNEYIVNLKSNPKET